MTNKELGSAGEEIAANYLMRQGYRILHMNWRLKGGCEIDIVAFKDNALHFVEVKTRKVGSATTPISAVNSRKQHRIVLAADSYLKANHIDFYCRFDVVGIIYNDTDSRVEHIMDAFRASPKFY